MEKAASGPQAPKKPDSAPGKPKIGTERRLLSNPFK
jgi:hypothetical protein